MEAAKCTRCIIIKMVVVVCCICLNGIGVECYYSNEMVAIVSYFARNRGYRFYWDFTFEQSELRRASPKLAV